MSEGQNRKRISLEEDYERRDWAAKFGVSEASAALTTLFEGAPEPA